MEVLELLDVPLWVFLSLMVLLTWYIWVTWNHGYFKDQGIPGPRPFPIFGTIIGGVLNNFVKREMDLLKYGKTVGLFNGSRPVLWTSDENILRQVFVKDFNNFTDRIDAEYSDTVISNMILTVPGDIWRRFRTLLSPSFSGAKLKLMNEKVNQCGRIFVKNLGEKADIGEVIDVTRYCAAFSMDVIARTGFGLEIDSQKDLDNPFAVMSKKILHSVHPGNLAVWGQFLPFLVPIFKALDITIFPKDAVGFFMDIINRTIDQREKMEMQEQVDFLQLMINAEKEVTEFDNEEGEDLHNPKEKMHSSDVKRSSVKGLTRDEILANALIFFLAGHETTASAVSYLLYNLAMFPECQDLLFQEVHGLLADKKHVDYASLTSLPYLEQCINESLRMYPPIRRTTRVSKREVNISGVRIQKLGKVAVPIYAMHHDPDIYSEPEKFKPERFSPEAKDQRSPYHFMPFGYGPRNCIGIRLAYMEIKMAMIHLVQNYRFLPCDKTEVPLKFKRAHLLSPKNGIWLKIERR